jgi:tetratricopeptide (TPR) repeat protein
LEGESTLVNWRLRKSILIFLTLRKNLQIGADPLYRTNTVEVVNERQGMSFVLKLLNIASCRSFFIAIILMGIVTAAVSSIGPAYSQARIEDAAELFSEADLSFDQGNYTAAITFYDKVLAIDPNNITALVNKGTALGTLGQNDDAITWLDKALAIDPNDISALGLKKLLQENIK